MHPESETNSTIDILIKHQNLIIFSGVVFFAIQALYFTILYRINMLYTVDWLGVGYLYDYITTGVFPYDGLVTAKADHLIIFPRLLVLPNLLFNSFDFVNMFYIQWGILALSLFVTYLLLRKTDPKLYWLLIPISAFIFNPLTNSNYWSFIILIWLLPSLGIISVIYLLDKKKLNLKILSAAISIAIVTTLSNVIGALVWLPGLISLIRINSIEKKWIDKKWLIIWISSMITIGTIYYSAVSSTALEINPFSLFSIEGFGFIATFAAVPFKLKYDLLMVAVGTASILIAGYCVYYFTILKKKTRIALPWILFILAGIIGAMITRSGRISDYHTGNLPYYIPIGEFVQIGLLVLVSLIILDIKNSPLQKHKKILLVFFGTVIIAQMILLVPSYYTGWWRGEYYYNEKMEYVNCFSLSHGSECVNTHSHGTLGAFKNNRNLDMINFWLENKMNVFGDQNFNRQNDEDLKEFENTWNNSAEYFAGYGNIETINDINVLDKKSIDIEKPVVIISGWSLDHNKLKLDSIFLMIDKKAFLKYDDFQPRPEIVAANSDAELYSGWQISFLSNYLMDGCHTLTLVGLKDDNKIVFDDEIQICKNYSTP